MRPVVYVAEFSSGKRYIGATTNFPLRRRNHRHEMRRGVHVNPRIQAEFAVCGVPKFTALASCIDPEALFKLEALLIEQHQPELNMPRPEKTLEINGKTYTTSHAASVFGVKPGLILQRLDSGWSPEQAVGIQPSPQKLKGDATRAKKAEAAGKHLIEFEGRKARLSDLCREHGLTYNRAKRRMDAGWTFKQVLQWWYGDYTSS